LNTSYSVNFEDRSNRTEFFTKKHKNDTKVRDELVFNSVRFGKSLTFDGFNVLEHKIIHFCEFSESDRTKIQAILN